MRTSLSVLALALVLSLAACGGGGEKGGRVPSAAPSRQEARPQTTAQRTPDLAAIGLRLGDLPIGFGIRSQGYVATEDTVATYRRDFDPDGARIGSSQLVDLESDIALFRNADEASGSFDLIKAALAGRSAPAFYKTILRRSLGFEPRHVRGRTIVAPEPGNGSVVAGASFDTPAGPADGVFVFILVGRLHGALFLIAPRGKLDIADAGPLVRVITQRMAAAEPAA